MPQKLSHEEFIKKAIVSLNLPEDAPAPRDLGDDALKKMGV